MYYNLENIINDEDSNDKDVDTKISYTKNINLSTEEVKLIGILPYLIYDLSKYQDHLMFIYKNFEDYKVDVLYRLEELLGSFCIDARYFLYSTFTYEDPEWNHFKDIDDLIKQSHIFREIDTITDKLEDICHIDEDLLKIFGINSEELYYHNQELQEALAAAICVYEEKIEELERSK